MFKNNTLIWSVILGFLIVGCKTKEKSTLYKKFAENPETSLIADFSYSGYAYGEKKIPVKEISVDVSKHGITPNAKFDQTKQIQRIIDSVGRVGGGVIFFPAGEYHLNSIKNERNYLSIDYSNIIVRGEKNTVFVDHQTLVQLEKSPWLSPAIIRAGNKLQGTEKFWGIPAKYGNNEVLKGAADLGVSGDMYPAKILSKITKDTKKGSKLLHVEATEGIKPGDGLLIAMYNTTDSGNLIRRIMSPWETFKPYMQTAKEAGPSRAASYQWLVEVDSVADKSIYLKQPFRTDILTEFKPVIAEALLLTGIGIENITFKSTWSGDYCHHGCKTSTKAEGVTMDYGWDAIQFVRVKHGWIKNVNIENFSRGIILLDSRNITVEDIDISGRTDNYAGHYGIKMYGHACDNLIQNINFKAAYTHMLSCEGNSYGNVFRKINYELATSNLKADFDFHGFGDKTCAPPEDNLFELLNGFNHITGGGGAFNLPHSAKGNTFWNVKFDGLEKGDDLFRYWVYDVERYGKRTGNDDYIYFPGTIITGATSKNGKIVVEKSTKERETDWLYFKNINNSVLPISLYEAQLNGRMKNKK